MTNFERRIKKLEGELNIGEQDQSAWLEFFKQSFPGLYQDLEDFCQKHQDYPDFVRETIEGKWSDKTINEFADFCLERVQERWKDDKSPLRAGN